MVRRRLVVLFSAIAMLLIGLGIVGSLVAATQSDGGRDWIRRQLARQLARGIKGKLHLGRLSGSFLTDLAIDSIQITDPDDSVFVATGPVRFSYDPRDIFDGRIIVHSVEVSHPRVSLRRDLDERWNVAKVFPSSGARPNTPLRRSAFGALVVFHNVRVHSLDLHVTEPWQPDDSLKGARRDSAIAVGLASTETPMQRVVMKGVRGVLRTLRWENWTLVLDRFRLRDPDSTGRKFDIVRLDALEHHPPFAFRNMRGVVLWRGDSIWLDLPHFELPHSAARAKGKLVWGSNLPLRWDVKIHGDSVGLQDVAWIQRTMPRSGGGSMDLHISSERDPHIIDYVVTNMDVRTTGSRLRGAMTWVVGGPVLGLRDINLALLPVDFALLETFNGRKFPMPWNGTVTGTLRGRGGPLNRFQFDEAVLAFTDRNVPGATAAAVLRGEVDILDPGAIRFHGTALQLGHFDLRTAQFLNADFPRLRGTVSGTATLDSVWDDVRFRDGDFTHRDGDDAPLSRFKGNGRVALGEQNVLFDVALAAMPLSATTMARSYPQLPLRGDFSGPLRARGTVADLLLTADLSGDAGRLQVDGQFDALPPGYGATARGTFSDFDVRRGLDLSGAPPTALNGRFTVDLAGDSLANLAGTAQVVADRSLADSLLVHWGRAGLHFAGGGVRVDSLRVESVAGVLTASGGLGLTARRGDTLRFALTMDSLGGVRRYLASLPVAADGVRRDSGVLPAADTLGGTLGATGTLAGSFDGFSLRSDVTGAELRLASTAARALRGSLRLDALPDSAFGAFTLRLDTVVTAGIALSRVEARAELAGDGRARATAVAEMPLGAHARASAEVRRRGDSTTVRIDTLELHTLGNDWALLRAATITSSSAGFAVDSLLVAGARGGRITLNGRVPVDTGLSLFLRVDAVPLADFGELVQARPALEGTTTLRAELHGSRARPDLYFNGTLRGALIAGARLDQVIADGKYLNRRLTTSLEYARKGVPAIHAQATVPIDLAFRPAGPRLLEEPMTGRVRTDSVGLDLFEMFSTSVSGAKGSLALDLDVAGTWRHPRLTGALGVRDGSLAFSPMGNVKLGGLEADVGFLGDSIAVRRLALNSGTRTATAELSGFIGIRDVTNPVFDLRLGSQGFHMVNRPDFVDLELTGEMRLKGAFNAATLSGSLRVDRGTIHVPELYQKRVISLDDPELYHVVDTSAFVDRRLLPDQPLRFVDNLTVSDVPVRMGPDVWLRSEEANINLGGEVSIARGRVQRGPRTGEQQLALVGPLQTVRGTYRLNLGPVQRSFTVESGELRFYGDPGLDATLSINALHTVRSRQFGPLGAQPDVRVRVHIGGTLVSPTAELVSPDSLRVTNADLISYLVTGGPNYEIGGRNGDYTSAAARVLLSSSFSVLAAKATGRVCDDAQLSAAGLEGYTGRIRDVSGSILSGTRFNCARQVSDKVLVRLDYGFCQVGQLLGGGAGGGFADALGIKLDYRIADSYTASLGMDPPTAAVFCSPDANARGFAPTPRQFGFDLFRLWRF